jgi:hypothetical protein
VISITLITTFAIVGVSQLSQVLMHNTEMNSTLGYIVALIEIVSEILCFAIVKLHLLVKNDAMEKYFEKLRDLETIVRSHHVRNKKVDKIVEDLRKSTLQLEIFFFVFNVALLISFCLCALSDVFAFLFDGILYMTFICFFLKMNMRFAMKLQSHLNQDLLNRQKLNLLLNAKDFLEIHRKIKQFLVALNRAFGLSRFSEILSNVRNNEVRIELANYMMNI